MSSNPTATNYPLNAYKRFLIQISLELTSTELEGLVYGLEIPKGRAESIKTVIDMLKYMEELALLKPGKYDELRKAMETINRIDLVEKIDNHIKTENNYGIQETTPSHSSNIPSSVLSERKPQACNCFERDGCVVNIGGSSFHFSIGDMNLVEMKLNNKFHINISNKNETGGLVNILFSRHDGNKQEKNDIRIEKHQNIRITGSTPEEFVFQGVETSGLSGQEFIQLTIDLQESTIYFQTRKSDGEYHILSEVMSVLVPQANGTKVHEVLEKIKKEYLGVAGSYLYNGKKILQAEDFISFPSNDHSEKHPLLLLKQSEKIAIKRSDSNQIKHIDVDPSQSTLEIIKQRVSTLFHSGQKYELKVDGNVVVDYMDCFKRKFVVALPAVEVEGASGSKFRDLGFLGGPLSGETSLFRSHFQCPSAEHDDVMEEILHNMKPDDNLREYLQVGLPEKKVELPEKKTEIACADVSATTTSCANNKVVFTIFLVPERT